MSEYEENIVCYGMGNLCIKCLKTNERRCAGQMPRTFLKWNLYG